MTDHQYLNILLNSIIDDEIGYLLEYMHLIKRKKHKNTWVKYFVEELRRLAQGVLDKVKVTNIFFPGTQQNPNRQKKRHHIWSNCL